MCITKSSILKSLTKSLGTAYIDYFKSATKETNPNAAKVWSRVNYNKQVLPNESEIKKALLDNKNVYFGPEVNTIVNFNSVPCKVSTESNYYFEVSLGWALQKHSPYRSLFNFHLTKIKESGQMSRLTTKYISRYLHFIGMYSRIFTVITNIVSSNIICM